jgi:diguanylate cyclase
MDSFAYVAPWVFGSVVIGIAVGVFLGRARGAKSGDSTAANRKTTTKVLAQVLGVAEEMAKNIKTHNAEIEENTQQVDRLPVTGEMVAIKHSLLHHVRTLMESNKRLNEDLTCARYRLEEQAQEIDHVRREARCDALTGIANRRSFDEKLYLMLDDWRRKGEPFVLVIADLDHFKRVNDAHTHQAGDRVLQAAANGLQKLSRNGDFVGRFGGDEFAIIMPNTTLEVGMTLAMSIQQSISEKAFNVSVRGGEVSISFSMGVAVSMPDDTDDLILQRADQAMYRSKNGGRNQVQCQTAELELALTT